MEFIRKHTPKLNREGLFIDSANHEEGYTAAKCFLRDDDINAGSSEAKYNALLFGASVDLLDYLIDRAKFLHKRETQLQDWIASGDVDLVHADIVVGSELHRLLEIIKKAGVEVVYE